MVDSAALGWHSDGCWHFTSTPTLHLSLQGTTARAATTAAKTHGDDAEDNGNEPVSEVREDYTKGGDVILILLFLGIVACAFLANRIKCSSPPHSTTNCWKEDIESSDADDDTSNDLHFRDITVRREHSTAHWKRHDDNQHEANDDSNDVTCHDSFCQLLGNVRVANIDIAGAALAGIARSTIRS